MSSNIRSNYKTVIIIIINPVSMQAKPMCLSVKSFVSGLSENRFSPEARNYFPYPGIVKK